MFSILVNKTTRIDGVPFIIAVLIVGRCHIKVQSSIRSIGDYIPFIHPTVIVSRIIVLHQSDERPFAPSAVTTQGTWAYNRVIHTIQAILYLTHARSPVTKISFRRRNSLQPHGRTDFIQFRDNPFWKFRHGTS